MYQIDFQLINFKNVLVQLNKELERAEQHEHRLSEKFLEESESEPEPFKLLHLKQRELEIIENFYRDKTDMSKKFNAAEKITKTAQRPPSRIIQMFA